MIDIRKATDENELKNIAFLANEIWHECFTDIISEKQIDYMVDKFQSFSAMKNQVIIQNYTYYSVYDNSELCGYFAVKPENDNRMFLSKLYLKKYSRGKGVARTMLEKVFSEAVGIGKSSVYLTVNKHNMQAISVYKKIGFNIVDSTISDIGEGFVMDDYIMEYNISD